MSTSYERCFFFFFLLVLAGADFVLFSVAGASTVCEDNGKNHTSNSLYDANLDTLLSTISTNLDDSGFLHASYGENPNRANAIVFCRGDAQLEECRRCVDGAIPELRNACRSLKQGVLWDTDCMLRYASESIFGMWARSSILVGYSDVANVSHPDSFTVDLMALLNDVRDEAAYGGLIRKVAANKRHTTYFRRIFALMQCTPDLSPGDCIGCLTGNVGYLPYTKKYARVFSASCDVRYGTSMFYNETRLQELRPPRPPPPPSPSPPPPPPPIPTTSSSGQKENKNKTPTLIIVSVVSTCVCILFLVLFGFLFVKKRKPKPNPNPKLLPEEDSGVPCTVESLQFDICTIKDATNNFSDFNKLGEGGFGVVYKGVLKNGEKIAVKRLSKSSGQGDLEFKNEVLLVAKLQHRNLVRLLGFCIHGDERILVYEFVENLSLDEFIFNRVKRSYLDWELRYKIIEGIARGLLYLHEDSRLTIIHRDLKAGNVLLDGSLNPKIADFGMATLFTVDETQRITSRIVGTYGYMAPEYAIHGRFSVKSDVFSFGVLLLEIISGQRNNHCRIGESNDDLRSCAWKHWCKRTAANLIDPILRRTSSIPIGHILRYIHIGLLCVQENASDRPTMASVVVMLGSYSLTLPLPNQPGFFVPDGSTLRRHDSAEVESTKIPTDSSSNEVTITEMYPR